MTAGVADAASDRVRPGLAVAAALLLNPALGALYAWSVFVAPLEGALGAPRAEISLVFSVAIVAFTAGMLLTPQAYRLLPAPALLLGAVGLCVAGLAASAAAGAVWQLVLGYGVAFGFGSGSAYSVTLQLISLALARRRGLASGLGIGGYAAGSILLSVLFAWTVVRFGPFATFAGTALGLGAIGLGAAALVGLSGLRLPNLSATPKPEAGGGRVFALMWTGYALGAMAGFMAVSQAAGIATSYGAGATLLTLAVAGVAAGNAAGRLAGGWLADLVPPARVTAAAHALGAVSFAVLLAFGGPWLAAGALTLQGLAYGLISTGYPSSMGIYFGVANFGRYLGRLLTSWGLAGLTAPWLAGWLFDRYGDYRWACIFGLIVSLLAVLAALAVPPPARNR